MYKSPLTQDLTSSNSLTPKPQHMRTLITSLLFIAIVVSASAQQANSGFIIKGSVKGIENGNVYLAFRDDDGKIHNEKVPVTKGKFEFKGQVTEPKHFYISTDAQVPPGEFFVENTTISISLDQAAPDKLVVKGSKSNEQFLAFKASEKDVVEAYAKLEDMYFKAIQNSDKQMLANADALKADIDARHRQYLKTFCATNPTSSVAEYLVLHTLEFDKNIADIKPIFAELDPSLTGNYTGKIIENKLHASLKDVASEKPEADMDSQPKVK
jgi:hypothetical protein